MDCREFCDQHVAFVDDTLAGIELVRMQRHLTECESCAKHDAKIRRALLLFRNLPSIEPSADFSQRLEARLRNCEYDDLFATTQRNLRRGAIAATVASVLMLGYIGTTLFNSDSPRDLVMAPVVATHSGAGAHAIHYLDAGDSHLRFSRTDHLARRSLCGASSGQIRALQPRAR